MTKQQTDETLNRLHSQHNYLSDQPIHLVRKTETSNHHPALTYPNTNQKIRNSEATGSETVLAYGSHNIITYFNIVSICNLHVIKPFPVFNIFLMIKCSTAVEAYP